MKTPKHDPAAPAAAAHHGNGSSNGNGNGNGSNHAVPATGAGRSAIDSDITARIKAAFGALPDLIALRVGVETQDGVVTLTRFVESRMQTEAAVAIATQVAGVKYVNDHLVANPRSRRQKGDPRTRRIEDLRGSDREGSHE